MNQRPEHESVTSCCLPQMESTPLHALILSMPSGTGVGEVSWIWADQLHEHTSSMCPEAGELHDLQRSLCVYVGSCFSAGCPHLSGCCVPVSYVWAACVASWAYRVSWVSRSLSCSTDDLPMAYTAPACTDGHGCCRVCHWQDDRQLPSRMLP